MGCLKAPGLLQNALQDAIPGVGMGMTRYLNKRWNHGFSRELLNSAIILPHLYLQHTTVCKTKNPAFSGAGHFYI